MTAIKPILGIHVGSYSMSGAVWINDAERRGGGQMINLCTETNDTVLPSVVTFTKKGPLVGDIAIKRTKKDPAALIKDVKSLLGRTYDEVSSDSSMCLGQIVNLKGKVALEVKNNGISNPPHMLPEQVYAVLIAKLKSMAEEKLRTSIHQAVMTLPRHWTTAQVKAVEDAVKIAGLQVLKFIYEDEAALLTYVMEPNIQLRQQDVWLVFRMGSRNCTVSLLQTYSNKIQLLATRNEKGLGGSHINGKICQLLPQGWRDSIPKHLLIEECEAAKNILSSAITATIYHPENEDEDEVSISREALSLACAGSLWHMQGMLSEVLAEAKVRTSNVSKVILAGGASNMPMIEEMIQRVLPEKVTKVNRPLSHGAIFEALLFPAEGAAGEGIIRKSWDSIKSFMFGPSDFERTKHKKISTKLSKAEEKAKESYTTTMELKVNEAKTMDEIQSWHQEAKARSDEIFRENTLQVDVTHTKSVLNRMSIFFSTEFQRYLNNFESKQIRMRYNTWDLTKPIAIGIDLGTTYSCVGIYREGRVIIVEDEGKRTVPSVVAFTPSGEIIVGHEATYNAITDPENTVFEAKRMMGRRFNDDHIQENIKRWPFKVIQTSDEYPAVVINEDNREKLYSPQQISSEILKKMKTIADSFLKNGVEVRDAVVTVPAYFNDAQRKATLDAAKIAGLNLLRIINEPTAAALAYGLKSQVKHTRKILVIDVGGGTSDVSLLQVTGENFEVKATAGDNQLGGEDFDTRLVNHCLKKIKKIYGNISSNKIEMRRLRTKCEEAKRVLSTENTTSIEMEYVLDEDTDIEIMISRKEFEEMNEDLFQRVMKKVNECLTEAKMCTQEVQDIVPVGGSMRIPRLKELLQNIFRGKELYAFIDPDEAVACGAAVLAAQELGTYSGHIILSDVIPMSLGIQVKLESEMSHIIQRNSKIPYNKKNTENYCTMFDNQEVVTIRVYQGENKFVRDNTLLGEFDFKELQKKPAGKVKINVTFDIDVNGILTVTAVECGTKKTAIKVIEKYRGQLSIFDVQHLAA